MLALGKMWILSADVSAKVTPKNAVILGHHKIGDCTISEMMESIKDRVAPGKDADSMDVDDDPVLIDPCLFLRLVEDRKALFNSGGEHGADAWTRVV